MLLIDTCGWVDFLRPHGGALADQVAAALASDKASLCSVSVAELLQGVKGAKEKRQLDLLFASVPIHEVQAQDWRHAGQALHALRLEGFQAPLSDALIAAVAKRLDLAVLTNDAHFQRLGVRLIGQQ